MVRVVLDLETNGHKDECDTIWCCVAKNIDTKEVHKFDCFNFEEFNSFFSKITMWIGHNIIDFDIPVMKRILNLEVSKDCKIVDTLVLSKLLNPERYQHGLEYWGDEFGIQKPPIDDWTVNGPDKLHRCEQDVLINERLYDHLLTEAKANEGIDWKLASKIEHTSQRIATEQADNGVLFNEPLATYRIYTLDNKIDTLDKKIEPYMQKRPEKGGVNNAPFKKVDGSYNQRCFSHFDDPDSLNISGPYSVVDWVVPNLGSRVQIIQQLQRYGWEPIELTDKGNPRLTLESIEACPRLMGGVGKDISHRFIYAHRRSQIKGWLDKLRPDGRLSAKGNVIGTPTRRWTHKVVVNVPGIDKLFGGEMRELYTVPKGYVMVGCDASGLELRMLAHEMNDEALTFQILDGDFHQLIYEILDEYMGSRKVTKNWEYAMIFGAGFLKLGKMCTKLKTYTKDELMSIGWKYNLKKDGYKLYLKQTYMPIRDAIFYQNGKDTKALVMAGMPSLKELIDRLQEEGKSKGYVKAIDGSCFFLRRGEDGKVQTHKALNTRLQGNGAIVMKAAKCILNKNLIEEKLDAKFVIDMHDEWQLEVLKKDSERVAVLATEAIIASGKFFKLNIPLDGESKIGLNWRETH